MVEQDLKMHVPVIMFMRLTRTNILRTDREPAKSRTYIPFAMLTLTACASAPIVDRIGQPPKECGEQGCQRPASRTSQASPRPEFAPEPIGIAPEPIGIAPEPIGLAPEPLGMYDLPLEPLVVEAPRQKSIPTRYPGITLVDGLTSGDPGFLTAFTPTAKAFKFKAGDTIPLDELENAFGKLDRTKPTIILVGRRGCASSQKDEKAVKQDRLSRKVNAFVFIEGHPNNESLVKDLLFDGEFNCPTVALLDRTGKVVLLTEEIGGSHGFSKKFAAVVREVIEHK